MDREQQLDEVITAYLQAVEAGQPIDQTRWLERYPDLAADLAEYFAGQQSVERVAEPFRGEGSRIRYFGDYELLEEIARGGMGVVYKARQVKLQRIVAVKMILAGELADATDVERFYTEARAAANLHHPHIVAIHEIGQHHGQHYFSMDHVAGESLASRIARGPLPAREAAALLKTVAEAVAFAHVEGVIHRDLKPANILLDSNNEPHVMDFGLAKRVQAGPGASATGVNLTQTGQVLGTPSYMPPEQAGGRTKEIGPRSDVYSLGAVLYCALTGRPPFQAASTLDTLLQVLDREPVSPRALDSAVPRDLETICLKCLEKDPRQRYASARELADELERFLEAEPIIARPLGAASRAWRWCRRKPALAATGALAATALAATVVLAVSFALFQSRAASRDRRMLAESYLEKGQILCEQGDVTRGMLWLARSLDTVPANAPDLQRVIRANLGAWSLPPAGLRWSLRLQNGVSVVAFSADGTMIMTEEGTHTALLWETDTLKQIGRLEHSGMNMPSRTVAFNPDGKTIATECYNLQNDATARLWDVTTGKEIRRFGIPPRLPGVFDGHTLGYATSLVFSRDGKRLLTTDAKQNVRLWDVATGKSLGTTLQGRHSFGRPHEDWIEAVALSPDGKTIVTGSRDKTAQLWDTATGKPIGTPLMHEGWVGAVVFSPDGKTILTGCLDGNAQLWDRATGKLVGAPFPLGGPRSNHSGVVAVAFSPDGRKILTAAGHDARHWDAVTLQPIGQPLRHRNDVWSVAYSPDGKTVLTGSGDSTARLWDVPEQEPSELILPHNAPVQAAAFSPDGSMVGTGSFSEKAGRTEKDPLPYSEARLWDAATGKPLGDPLPHQIHQERPLKVAFSPDGKVFAMLSEFWDFKGSCSRSVIHRWDVASRQPVGQPLVQKVNGGNWATGGERLVFAADGKTLRAIDRQGLIQEWDLTTSQPIGAPQQVKSNRPEAPSPDGKRILCGHGMDNTAFLRDAIKSTQRSWVSLGSLPHKGPVEAVAFQPDGALLLTGSDDKTARLWDAATLAPIGPPLKHEGPVRTVAFSLDGKMILTASLDKTVRLWRVPPVVEGETRRLVLWPEVNTGTQLFGPTLDVLSAEEWLKRKQRLEEMGGPPLP
jgi:WD40 repeat protein/tRNA A-37 threonylcarbamoyl transferase component Bud32